MLPWIGKACTMPYPHYEIINAPLRHNLEERTERHSHDKALATEVIPDRDIDPMTLRTYPRFYCRQVSSCQPIMADFDRAEGTAFLLAPIDLAILVTPYNNPWLEYMLPGVHHGLYRRRAIGTVPPWPILEVFARIKCLRRRGSKILVGCSILLICCHRPSQTDQQEILLKIRLLSGPQLLILNHCFPCPSIVVTRTIHARREIHQLTWVQI